MLENLVHILLKKIYKFNENIIITEKDFSLKRACFKGKVFRTCASIWPPSAVSPFDEKNWIYKICAVVVLGVKILEFTAKNPGNK